jgi:hypothetical protein
MLDLQVAPSSQTPRPPAQPAKRLLSKWTALTPVSKEKHFLVTKLITR